MKVRIVKKAAKALAGGAWRTPLMRNVGLKNISEVMHLLERKYEKHHK